MCKNCNVTRNRLGAKVVETIGSYRLPGNVVFKHANLLGRSLGSFFCWKDQRRSSWIAANTRRHFVAQRHNVRSPRKACKVWHLWPWVPRARVWPLLETVAVKMRSNGHNFCRQAAEVCAWELHASQLQRQLKLTQSIVMDFDKKIFWVSSWFFHVFFCDHGPIISHVLFFDLLWLNFDWDLDIQSLGSVCRWFLPFLNLGFTWVICRCGPNCCIDVDGLVCAYWFLGMFLEADGLPGWEEGSA